MSDRRGEPGIRRMQGRWVLTVIVLLALAACDGDGGKDIVSGDTLSIESTPGCFFTGGVPCGDLANGVNGCVRDSCNWCGCEAQREIAACTLVGCDTITCTNGEDCPEGHECLWNAGCGETHGYCNRQTYYCPHTAHAFTLCDCEGNTIRIDANSCLPDRRYDHAGACE